MSFFRRLLGAPKKTPSRLRAPGLLFDNARAMPSRAVSPSGRYVAGALWCTGEIGKPGFEPGAVALDDAVLNQTLFLRRIYRPSNPQVDDLGNVYFEDQSPNGAMAITAWTNTGKLRWVRWFSSYVRSSELAQDGRTLRIHVNGSDDEDQGRTAYVLDSGSGAPLIRESDSYADELAIEHQRLFYWPSGEFIASCLAQGSPRSLADGAARASEWCARDNEIDSPARRAQLWRMRGEIAEKLGEHANAIEFWTRAIEIDPKVGIAKRLATLRKGRR